MGKREDYEAKTEKLIMPIVEANNVELLMLIILKRVRTGICAST